MQATHSDLFALKKSGLDTFLYADVGAEVNGSTLTILSILARLGKDPWAEAERWAALPKAAVIDSLAQSIAEMPLAPSALAGARDSAARLVQLLPSNMLTLQRGVGAQSAAATSKVVPPTMLYWALAVWMVLNVLLASKPPSNAPAPVAQSTVAPYAIHPAAKSLSNEGASADLAVAPDQQ